MDAARQGARALFERTLRRQAADAWSPAEAPLPKMCAPGAAAAELEEAVHSDAGAALARRAHAVDQALARQTGSFPDDIVGLRFLRGELSAAETAALGAEAAPPPPTPRETLVRSFVQTLAEASPAYAADRPRTLHTARALESSCYNHAIAACERAPRPLPRSWQSPTFVEIYGAACGVLLQHLNPGSAVCRAYGTRLLEDLVAGRCEAETLGGKSEAELCPEATEKERREIALQAGQKVDVKESTLYACPHCGARRCTYVSVQSRSLDEPAELRCKCQGCGKNFRVSG